MRQCPYQVEGCSLSRATTFPELPEHAKEKAGRKPKGGTCGVCQDMDRVAGEGDKMARWKFPRVGSNASYLDPVSLLLRPGRVADVDEETGVTITPKSGDDLVGLSVKPGHTYYIEAE